MTSQPHTPREQTPPRPEVRTLNLKTTLTQFAMLAIMFIGAWWFHSQLTSQNSATVRIDERTREIDEKIVSTDRANRQAVETVNATLSTMKARLGSITGELETARGQLGLLKQEVSDRKAQQAVSESNALEVRIRARQISDTLTDFAQTLSEWHSQIALLKKREANSTAVFTRDDLDRLDYLFSVEHADSRQIAGWQQRLAMLQTPVDQILDEGDDSVRVPEENVQAIDMLAQQIQAPFAALNRDLLSLKALWHQFRAPAPEEETVRLEEVAARHRREVAQAASDRIIAQVSREQEQAADAQAAEIIRTKKVLSDVAVASEQLLREAQAEADLLQGQIGARQIREQSEKQRRDDERERQAARALAHKQQQQREYEQALPEMRRLLVPFLAAGNRQLNGTDWVQSDGKTPLSYAGIRATGALTSDGAGYQAFMWLAGGPYNDRANGVFPGYIGGDVSNFRCLGSIRRGQILLSEYGELLVANGLLAP